TAHDKVYVRPEELIRHLPDLEVEFGTSGLIHPGVLRVFNHANDRAPDFRILKPRIHTSPNGTACPKSFRQRLVDNHNRHRLRVLVLLLEGTSLQQTDLHRLEVIVTNDIPIVDVLRWSIGCWLVAFDLGV